MNTDINNIDPILLEEDDRIVAFLRGQMSAEEEQEFLKELEKNPELKEKAIIIARLVKGLKEVGSEQDQNIQDAILASSEQDVETAIKNAMQAKDDDTPAKVISIRKTAKWLSIAASIICIVWLGFTYNSYRSTTALGNQYDDAFSSDMVVRGQETQSEAEMNLEKLFSDVKNNQNIEETIHELSLCWELSMKDTLNDYTNYSPEIGWNLAIAHLKDNNKKEAKKVLEKLISITEESSAVNVKAKELLGKL